MVDKRQLLDDIENNLVTTFPTLHNIAPIHLLGDGWGSIAVEGHNSMVFRIAKNTIIQEQHKRQVKILLTITSQLSGVEIPYPTQYIESSQAFPFGVMGYQKIEGEVFDPTKTTKKDLGKIAFELAKLLLQFHTMQITGELQNLPIIDYSGEKLEELWEKVESWLHNHFTLEEYKKAEKWWQEAVDFFTTYQAEHVIVHGDPWYENIILDSNGSIRGIVDFDKVALRDRAIDFVVQQYAGQEFMQLVTEEYKKLGGNLGDHFEKRVALLAGIKRIEDLNYCLTIDYMYPHLLEKIQKAIL